jgi:hypothetical protein
MGLFLTLLYILTAYLGPGTLWGALANFHIEIVIAGLATLASLPGLGRAKIFSMPQSFAVCGMVMAVFTSMLFTGWLGSVPGAVLNFIPNAFTFFLVVINCRRKRHLQLLTGVLLAACLFTLARGYMALHAGDYASPYLIGQGNDEGESLYRVRGLAFINDPNDFAQLMASLIPCLFLTWRKASLPRNLLLVLIPASILIFGMYLTHSRGGMVALLLVILLASRRKIGTIPATIIAGLGFAAAMVLGWSGGRDVSVEAGSDRLEAWSTGLELIKTHPLFGVGFQRFTEYFYITAHNTVVVCAAELGMFGLFWWLMFILPTIRDAYVSSSDPDAVKVREQDQPMPYETGYREPVADLRWQAAGHPAPGDAMESMAYRERDLPAAPAAEVPLHLIGAGDEAGEQLSAEEIRRMATLMLICVAGYLTAGWFLSRAYVMTLFIYAGMVQVIYRWALDQGIAPPRLAVSKIAQYSAVTAVMLILIVYAILRIQHLMGIH